KIAQRLGGRMDPTRSGKSVQRLTHFERALIATRRIFGECLQDDLLELNRYRRVDRARRHHLTLDNFLENVEVTGSAVELLPHHHLEQHDAGGVDIAAAI